MQLFTVLLALSASALSSVAFKNPLKDSNGSDPHLTYFEGNYYMVTTTWDDLQITTAPTLAGLKTATPQIVYTDKNETRNSNFWAPELHRIDNVWHLYYTAGTNGTFDNQRTHVLQGGASPADPFEYLSRIEIPGRDVWAIDSTVLTVPNVNFIDNYLVYSSWEGDNQQLWIAKMANASTLSSNSTMISTPTYDWETIGDGRLGRVNEGASPLYNAGRTWLTYSASGCAGGNYTLGLLELMPNADPLVAKSWVKTEKPVFSAANGALAPGHNANFLSPDGTEWWNIYHANKDVNGSMLCNGERDTRAQKITWARDGTPDFGVPYPLDFEITPPSGEKSE